MGQVTQPTVSKQWTNRSMLQSHQVRPTVSPHYRSQEKKNHDILSCHPFPWQHSFTDKITAFSISLRMCGQINWTHGLCVCSLCTVHSWMVDCVFAATIVSLLLHLSRVRYTVCHGHYINCVRFTQFVVVIVKCRTQHFTSHLFSECGRHNAESDVVRFIAQYGVLYGGMASGIGQNVLTYSRHYQLPASYLLSDYCTARKIEEICKTVSYTHLTLPTNREV